MSKLIDDTTIGNRVRMTLVNLLSKLTMSLLPSDVKGKLREAIDSAKEGEIGSISLKEEDEVRLSAGSNTLTSILFQDREDGRLDLHYKLDTSREAMVTGEGASEVEMTRGESLAHSIVKTVMQMYGPLIANAHLPGVEDPTVTEYRGFIHVGKMDDERRAELDKMADARAEIGDEEVNLEVVTSKKRSSLH